MGKGVYSLIVELKKGRSIKIGKLGRQKFKKGIYIYTGSAMNGLDARIERHLKKRKKKFWHIDFLLSDRHVRIISILKLKTRERIECRLNQIILKDLNGKVLVNRFGSSDCKCKSHLIYLGNKP